MILHYVNMKNVLHSFTLSRYDSNKLQNLWCSTRTLLLRRSCFRANLPASQRMFSDSPKHAHAITLYMQYKILGSPWLDRHLSTFRILS